MKTRNHKQLQRRPETPTVNVGWQKPWDVDGLTVSLGAGREVYQMMPPREEIPAEFWRNSNRFNRLSARWFFFGLNISAWTAKPGIDRSKAVRHLGAIQRSFEPPHEHKEAAVAYLMSLWFDVPESMGAKQ